MEIILLFAQGTNGAFGLNHQLPWRVPADLRMFKEITNSHAVLMGRHTWESLPPGLRPLPNRMNFMLSSRFHPHVHEHVESYRHALERAERAGHTKLFVIGGAGLIEQMAPLAHRVIITQVPYEGDFDVSAPEIDLHDFKLENVKTIAPGVDVEHYHRKERALRFKANPWFRARQWVRRKLHVMPAEW